MKCASCYHEINTTYTYTLVRTSVMEVDLANVCSECWADLVGPLAARRLRRLWSVMPLTENGAGPVYTPVRLPLSREPL